MSKIAVYQWFGKYGEVVETEILGEFLQLVSEGRNSTIYVYYLNNDGSVEKAALSQELFIIDK